MPDSLNVIALISGGKDSLFSLLHCIQNGHKVVALANLCPPTQPTSIQGQTSQDGHQDMETEGADLNSFMYQTVGHSIIPLYSSALRLPLYRHPILGSCVQQSQYYDTSASSQHLDNGIDLDETEDLVPLLRQVISAHPEANAVSTGAILSTYQRTRVESIVVRLGLTPLSYLWQYPVLPPPTDISKSMSQTNKHRPEGLTGLLKDMGSSGLDARIIKIASAGISENLLFANIADSRTQSRLIDGLSPFFEDDDEIGLRGAVLGEGGEYETIALSGPKEVWSGGRIVIDEVNNGSHTEEGVTYLTFGKARLVPHDEEASSGRCVDKGLRGDLVPIPAIFDSKFVHVRREMDLLQPQVHENENVANDITASNQRWYGSNQGQIPLHVSYTATSTTVTVSNLTARSVRTYLEDHSLQVAPPPAENSSVAVDESTVSSQLEMILTHLPAILTNLSQAKSLPSISTMNISSTTLLLSSMSNFVLVNPIYARIYPVGLPNPPSRVTIATLLPQGSDISLSMTFDLCPLDQRRGLHVQGRSYWAPANIGPYSQAIAVPLFNRMQRTNTINTDNDDDNSRDDTVRNRLEVVYIAGQIPLVPSSMEVHPGPFSDTSVLSLQHLWRVGQERGVDIWPWTVAYLAEDSKRSTFQRAAMAAEAWKHAHLKPTWASDLEAGDKILDETSDDDADGEDSSSAVDIWDIQRNRSQYTGFRKSNMTVGKHLHILPNHSLFSQPSRSKDAYIPPFIAAEVIALPRNVNIEWWSNGIAGLAKKSYSSKPPQLEWESKVFEWGSLSCLTITPNPANPAESVKFIAYLLRETNTQSTGQTETRPIPAKLFHLLDLLNYDTTTSTHRQVAQSTTFLSVKASRQPATPFARSTTMIPCHTIRGHRALILPTAYSTTARTKHTQESESSNGPQLPCQANVQTGTETATTTEIQDLCFAVLLRVNTS